MFRLNAAGGGRRGGGASFHTSRNPASNLRAILAVTACGTSLTALYFWSKKRSSSAEEKKLAFDPKSWKEFPLVKKEQVSPNTALYRFGFEPKDEVANLPVASYLLIQSPPLDGDDKPVIRPYTPISRDGTEGHFDLLIKSYPTGKVSKYIGELKIGEKIKVKGPNVKMPYTPNMKKEIGMIAGGTGITPMIQVVDAIVSNPEDKTHVTLLFANVTKEDILLESYLKKLPSDRVKVHYTLDKPPADWNHFSGYITEDMLKSVMPAPGPDTLILVCGPPPMVNMISGPKTEKYEQGVLTGQLKKLGYNESQVFKL